MRQRNKKKMIENEKKKLMLNISRYSEEKILQQMEKDDSFQFAQLKSWGHFSLESSQRDDNVAT